MPISSSTLQGLFTWPEMQKSLVPVLFGRPMPANQLGPAAQDGRRDGDRFDVVHRRRAAVEAGAGRERRLQPRHALLALEALEQRGLLAADVGAGAAMDIDVELPARAAGILADQARRVGLA